MHKTLLTFSLLLSAIAANAQQVNNTEVQKLLHRNQIRSKHAAKILQQQANAANKTTAAHKRLASYGLYVSNGGMSLTDSTLYKYSNARGSKFNFTDMFFYNDEILADSSVHFTDGGGGLMLSDASAHMYNNTTNQRTSTISYIGTSLNKNSKTEYVRDGAGNIIGMYNFQWLSGAWDTVNKTVYTFNSLNKMTSETTSVKSGGSWEFSGKTEYTYDANNNLALVLNYNWDITGSTWVQSNRETNDYYPGNKLKRNLVEDFNGSAWEPNSIDSFGYSTPDFYTYMLSKTWNPDSVRWDNSSLETRHLNASNLPDTIYYSEWDTLTKAWVPNLTSTWRYNADGDPDFATSDFYIMGFPVPILEYYFHYETYFDLNVNDVNATSKAVLYPNPATDKLTISWKEAVKGSAINITVVNSMGQVMQKQQLPANANKTELDVSHMPVGIYNVIATNDKGESICRMQFVKQ